jgi:hypothetical protein
VRKRQRRLSGVDDLVVSLTAKGLTTGEVSAHLAEVYGANVSTRPRRLHGQRHLTLRRKTTTGATTPDNLACRIEDVDRYVEERYAFADSSGSSGAQALATAAGSQ